MNHAKQLVARFKQDESGQNLVEYALVIALVALAAVTAMGGLGTAVSGAFTKLSSSLSNAM